MRNQMQDARSKKFRRAVAAMRRGFSLVEVLLAMFILGIGMIMVASVFPVGANWTRQTTEDSVAQTVVQNALSVIRTHYGPTGNMRFFLNSDYLILDPTLTLTLNTNNNNTILNTQADYPNSNVPMPFVLQALPGFIPLYDGSGNIIRQGIPFNERAYQFGSSTPFPAANWKNCTYFWTALARLNPGHRNFGWVGSTQRSLTPPDLTNGIIPSSNYNYDIYILVFRKGAVEQKFSHVGIDALVTSIPKSDPKEYGGTRIPSSGGLWTTMSESDSIERYLLPSVACAEYIPGSYDTSTRAWQKLALPAPGQNGIGLVSGTVFKQVLEPPDVPNRFWPAHPWPGLITDEPIIVFPAADGAAVTANPLIYIYQTTMTF
jgi:prepilin-type N-terminal cleavage/methylation domain-containing protein